MALVRLDVNVDMGESFGRWRLGDDAAILPFVSSANIACGFHAGDAATMRETTSLAAEAGVRIGAHVALPDLLGFGRRRMAVSSEQVKDYAAYQIGALSAFAHAAGSELAHVKPHGALYAMCSEDPELAGAVAEAVAEFDGSLPLLLLSGRVAPAVESHGVRLVEEAFVDLEYSVAGALLIEATKRAWDPDRVAARALRLAREGVIDAQDRTDIPTNAVSVCIHGDGPNAVEIARTVKRRLEEAGVAVSPL